MDLFSLMVHVVSTDTSEVGASHFRDRLGVLMAISKILFMF